MYPLTDDSVIAGVKTAREIRMLLVVWVCFLIQANFAGEKCVVFRKNAKGKTDARCDAFYRADVKACFGISDSPGGKICGRYRKAVTEFQKTGKTFLNVSMIILLTEKCVLKVSAPKKHANIFHYSSLEVCSVKE